MTTYRVDLGYDGTGFKGYARQDGLRTVQGELEAALSTVVGDLVETAVAGRTDAGVHARAQVVTFHADMVHPEQLRRSLNGIIGPEIAVMRIREVEDGFHARFSAKWRRYRYSIDTGPAPDPMARHTVWHVGRDLDQDAMATVAEAIVGEHDFSSFCRSIEGTSNIRRVESAEWRKRGPSRLEFRIQANAFCQQMVRSIVGFCYDVGRGFASPESVSEVMRARSRSAVVTLAPPHGLTLWEVGY
jgi:tRNA pseudouridine38-40 synthase